MLKSMTAFSRVQTHHDATEIVWEIRSINHRYLETSFRLPEELRALEFDLRKIAQEHLSRGHFGRIQGSCWWHRGITILGGIGDHQ